MDHQRPLPGTGITSSRLFDFAPHCQERDTRARSPIPPIPDAYLLDESEDSSRGFVISGNKMHRRVRCRAVFRNRSEHLCATLLIMRRRFTHGAANRTKFQFVVEREEMKSDAIVAIFRTSSQVQMKLSSEKECVACPRET